MALTKVKLIADGVITSANLDASHGITTSDIGEGSNLYYTDSRVSSYLSTNGFATQTDIVAAITDSAPVTLDTLNELAAALGDDPNFATTTATSLGLKAPLASPSFTGNIDVAGNITVGNNDSILAENNLRFKSAGAAYIDHNTVGQSFIFRTSTSSSLDTTALTINSSGKVGIGIAPSYTLHVQGASGTIANITDGTQSIDFYNGSGLSEIAATTKLLLSTSGTTALTIDSSQNATFEGNVVSKDTFYLENGSGNRWQMLFDTNAFNLRYYNGSSWSADAFAIDTSNNATFASRVTLGSGTTGSPYDNTTFLHVKGTTRSIVQQSSTADAYYMFGDAGANNVAWLGYDHSTDQLSLHTSGTTYIDGNTTFAGTVTVGTGAVAAANAVADDFVITGPGTTATGMTISNSSDAGTGTIFFGDTTSSSAAGFRYNHNTGDMAISAEDNITFTCDNVGIGTTSPDMKLDVAGNIRARVAGNVAGGFYIGEGDTSEAFGLLSNGANGYFKIRDEYNSADRFYINYLGNVGIGTTSPTSGMKLDVQGGDFRVGDDANQGFEAGWSAGGGVVFVQGYNRGTSSFLDMSINNTVRITSGGNVGIGITSPVSKLQVNGDIGIGELNSTRSTNVRFAKNDVNVITFTIKVAAIAAWRPGSCWIQVSGSQNGLQEYYSAWYFIRLTHYYASGVAGQGTSNPACILDSGGDTNKVTVGVMGSNNITTHQEITITLTDIGATTNSMVADINCTMQVGIESIT